MAADRHASPSLTVAPDRPLVGVVLVEGDCEVVRYDADEAGADATQAGVVAAHACALTGAWADLNCEEAVAEFDRIRHKSMPTPPIDAL